MAMEVQKKLMNGGALIKGEPWMPSAMIIWGFVILFRSEITLFVIYYFYVSKALRPPSAMQ